MGSNVRRGGDGGRDRIGHVRVHVVVQGTLPARHSRLIAGVQVRRGVRMVCLMRVDVGVWMMRVRLVRKVSVRGCGHRMHRRRVRRGMRRGVRMRGRQGNGGVRAVRGGAGRARGGGGACVLGAFLRAGSGPV